MKFRNNPQHRRILVNEWISAVFLKYLQITTPQKIRRNRGPQRRIPRTKSRRAHSAWLKKKAGIEPGWHLDYAYPGDPNRTAVYDFIPDLLLDKVVNLADFLGVLVFDKWAGNADSRQSIFYRARLKQWVSGGDEYLARPASSPT